MNLTREEKNEVNERGKIVRSSEAVENRVIDRIFHDLNLFVSLFVLLFARPIFSDLNEF